MIEPGGIVVYRAQTRSPAGAHDALDDVERERIATLYRPQDRDRYLTAHLLMRLAVGEQTGIPVAEQRYARTCLVCGGPHGKPTLVTGTGRGGPTPHVSLSYSARNVLVALSCDAPVGVDVELWAATDFAGFATVALTPEEAQELHAFQLPDRPWARACWWARKEAALKATGHGLRVEATSLRVSPPDRPARLLDWTDEEIPRPTLALADVELEGEYSGAVARLGDSPIDLDVRDAAPLLDRWDDDSVR